MSSVVCSRQALALFVLAALGTGSANAQGAYRWGYWADRQESYFAEGTQSGRYVRRAIRFINIEYEGPRRMDLWHRAFVEAANFYKREGITFHRAKPFSSGDFFTVEGLSASRHRLVGWYDDNTGVYGFVAIHRVTTTHVFYTTNEGREGSATGPNNFEDWSLGYLAGDWDAGTESLVSVQVWKHTDVGTQAAVTFWLRGRRL